MKRKNFLTIILVLILFCLSVNIVMSEVQERVIVIISDESNKSVREKSDKLIKTLLEVRKTGKLGKVPDLREKFKKYNLSNKQEEKVFVKFGIKKSHLPILALMYIDKMGYPKKVLWKTKVDNNMKAISQLAQHLAKVPTSTAKLTPPNNPEKEKEMINAVKSGNVNKVKKLLKQNPNLAISRDDGSKGAIHKGKNPLHWAAIKGNGEIIMLILSAGADVNAKDKSGITPLGYSINWGKNNVTMILVKNKADVNMGNGIIGETPLHRAAAKGNNQVIMLLIDHGAVIDSRTKSDATPLAFAVIKGKKEAALVLLKKGADVNAKDNKGTAPIHLACGGMKDNDQIVKLLILKGAEVNAKNSRGFTPLHVSAFKGYRKITELLIKSGADVNAKNKIGITPLRIAKKRKKSEIVEILKKAGAKR
ncbi:MAG: ankyrin repeat domain-containing protein [Candidatus Eremiobacteraeota bacterium]|nr:ankyrin repeat domain-containing protein [Candidatus Eremiobacteraeota bacterium]